MVIVETKKSILGIFLIIMGVSVIVVWSIILGSESPKEGKTELIFHLFSELMMASSCIIAGIYILLNNKNRLAVTMFSLGALLYSLVNAIGYYFENEFKIVALIFAILLLLTFTITHMAIKH